MRHFGKILSRRWLVPGRLTTCLALAAGALACTPIRSFHRAQESSAATTTASSSVMSGASQAGAATPNLATAQVATAVKLLEHAAAHRTSYEARYKCMDGKWAAGTSCDMSDRCETAAGPQMGTCVPVASECLIQSGAVFVYGRNKDEWIPTAYIKSAYPETPDDFGGCLAMHGETLVSTGTGEASHASGVGGDQTNNSQARAGAAFVFHRRSAPPVVPTFCGH